MKRNVIIYLTLFTVALLLRVSVVVTMKPWIDAVEAGTVLYRDANGYHQLALSVLHDGRFQLGDKDYTDALRTPGYPVLIAAIYAFAGERPWVVMLIQCLVDSLACIAVFSSTRRMFSPLVGLCAGLLYAVDPFLTFYCATLLSDTLFTAILVAGLWVYSRKPRSPMWERSILETAAIGVVLGIAILVRPVAVFFPLLAAAALVLSSGRMWRKGLVRSLIMVVATGATVSPWIIRNEVTYHSASLSTSGSYNLLFLNVLGMESGLREQPAEDIRADLRHEVDSVIVAAADSSAKHNPFQLAKYWEAVAVKHIQSHPIGFAAAYAKGIIFMFVNLNTRGWMVDVLGYEASEFETLDYHGVLNLNKGFLGRKSGVEIVVGFLTGMFLLFVYSATVVGLWNGRKRYPDRTAILCMLLFVGLYFILVTGPAGLARFRLPTIPFFLPFAGIGWEWLYGTVVKKRMRVP